MFLQELMMYLFIKSAMCIAGRQTETLILSRMELMIEYKFLFAIIARLITGQGMYRVKY